MRGAEEGEGGDDEDDYEGGWYRFDRRRDGRTLREWEWGAILLYL